MADQQLRLWRLFILGRAIVTGVFLALLLIIGKIAPALTLTPLFVLACVQFLPNGVYFYLWRRRDLAFLGYFAFSLEIVLITMLVYFLGPDGYAFVLAYLWPIIMGGWLIGRQAIAPLTALSALGYAFLVVLGRFGLVLKERMLTPDGISLALVLSLPYLAFVAMLVWLLTHERERNEENLRLRNQELDRINTWLRAILTNMVEGVFVADAQGNVLLANLSAANLLHILQGQPLPPWFREQMHAHPDADATQSAHHPIEFEDKTISISVAELSDGGVVSPSTIYVARDITQEAQVERMKSDFVAYVSHELRTPLTTIKMLVSLLLMDAPTDGRQREYLAVIQTQVERQSRLVSNLLDLTRLEAGRYELPDEKVDPRRVVQSAVSVCNLLAQSRGVRIEAACDRAPKSLISNGGGLEQVLINLLSNAVKFTPKGGHVGVICQAEGDQVVFRVQDSGIGMTPEQLGRIFNKFYTVRNPHKQGEGTGLGLVISDMIVKKLKGSIEVNSEPNVGSCFAVRLPLRAAA